MRKKTVDLIVDAADDLGIELERYDDYSGRGMYGTKTFGVVGRFSDLVVAVSAASRDMEDGVHEDFLDDLQNLHSDNLGRDFIYY